MKTTRLTLAWGLLLAPALTLMACKGKGHGAPASQEAEDPPPGPGTLGTAESLTQFGITWTFDRPALYGQFANGDYWVVGPATIISIDPPSYSFGDRVVNGSEINPVAGEVAQGFDSGMADTPYEAALNVAYALSASNALIVSPGSSLVSTISHPTAGNVPQLQTAAVLTVLAAPAPAGSFRPPYCGTEKSIKFNHSQLNLALLAKLPPVATVPSWSSAERLFERPWIDHRRGWRCRYFHPIDNMPDYGRDMSNAVGTGALMLHLDAPDSQKETLLVRYVQLGIDLHGIATHGGENNWYADGGHASGRKWPILFAGLMLDDTAMKGIGSTEVAFGEDQQTFYVQETSPGVYNLGFGGYTAADVGLPDWGIQHHQAPENDTAAWSLELANPYRHCCTAHGWWGEVLAAHLMDAKALWNHDALFDYMDRYRVRAPAENYPRWAVSWSDFALEMWDTYR